MAVKHILVSQNEPKFTAMFDDFAKDYGVEFKFLPFYSIEAVSSMEIRSQRFAPLEYDAIVFSAKVLIDAFFSLCETLRIKMPATMQYFCTNEKVALYLQKYVEYRKRKVFFGDGRAESVISSIPQKSKNDKFLIVTSDSLESSLTRAFDSTAYQHSSVMIAKSVPNDLKSEISLADFNIVTLCHKNDVASLVKNFPDCAKSKTKYVLFGSDSLVAAATEAGLKVAFRGPSEDCKSIPEALSKCIKPVKK